LNANSALWEAVQGLRKDSALFQFILEYHRNYLRHVVIFFLYFFQMSSCDYLVPDHCTVDPEDPTRTPMRIPLASAKITEYTGSTCYVWPCDYQGPYYNTFCRLDKSTGGLLCATRQSGFQLSCPGKIDGDFIVKGGDAIDVPFPMDSNEPCPPGSVTE
jgi:hypothetical protein